MEQDLSLGEFIKSLRKKAKISSTGLSQQLEKGNSYVSQVENNRILNPDYNTSYKMMEILNVDKAKINEVLAHYNIFPTNKPNKGDNIFREILNELHHKDGEALMEYPPVKEPDEINEKLAKECIAKLESFSDGLHPVIKSNPQLAMPVIKKMEEMAKTLFKDVAKIEIKRMLVDEDKSKVLLAAMEETIKEMKSEEAKKGLD